MKIFVAGATGVIGRRLVPLLVTSGLDVTAVARSENKARGLTEQGAHPVRVDIFDASAVERAVKGHDIVINMATHIPPSSKVFFPGSFNENNRIRQYASRNLSQAAMKTGAERFIQESFAAAYPDCGDEWIEESVPLEPAKYVRTVLDAERASLDFARGGGVGVVLRFSFLYGPDSDMSRDLVTFVRKGIAPLPGRPEGYMSSIWLDDAASAVVAALRVPSGAYNVTDDEPVSRRDAFDALAATIRAKPPKMLPAIVTKLAGSIGDTLGRSQRLSNKKLHDTSGWQPAVRSIIDGWPKLVAGIGSPTTLGPGLRETSRPKQ